MSGLHFQHPERVHLLWAVIGWLALWFAVHRRGVDVLPRFVGPALHGHLVHRLPPRRWWLRFACFALAGVALVVALMRPQWGLRFVQTPRMGAEMMVCLDVSKSMLAEDAAPSRLERAKADVSDLLGYLDGDHVGLIAFAGKATVLCPLTPDFGFYRLVLQGAGPQSVARGGTNVEAALRKAIAGFRTEADVSRIIVLITDGEDHDNFPLEAAKAAAERGIQVLAIGFGSETGSEIHVRDPATGARTLVRDRDGNAVRSRLDGDLLREIALKTGGAYIPAGTGTLELRSIYGAHIAPLTRGRLDGRGRPMRNEGFQWCILLALIGIGTGTWAGSGRPRLLQRFREVGLALLLLGLAPGLAWAEEKEEKQEPDAQPAPEMPDVPDDAREAYNGGVTSLSSGALDRAARSFEAARTRAGTDGTVRFRSSFNLGWVEVRRADAVLKDEPKKALTHLQQAADWFQDAVRLRPERTDARTNLELVLRRIRELADAIAKHDQIDVVKELDALIKSQRALVGELAEATDTLEGNRDDPVSRRAYRRLATEQRQRLADARGLMERVAAEQEAIESKDDKETKTEERIRAAQLGAARAYMQRATQRLGHARSQLRRRTIGRAFLRAAAALSELKHARDQFRNPVEILDALLADSTRVVGLAGQLVSFAERPPQWLTADHVDEQRDGLRNRTEELRARLAAGLEAPPPAPKDGEDPAAAKKAERLRETLKLAVPHLASAVGAFDAAHPGLKARRPTPETQAALVDAVEALSKARELFLDLKRLVELAYGVQRGLVDLLGADAPSDAPIEEIASVQRDNRERGNRLPALLDDARQAATPPSDPKQPSDPEAEKARKAYWDEAERLLATARQALDAAHESASLAVNDANLRGPAQGAAAEARDALDALRRHLFTIIERLRERLREQVGIQDESTTALAQDEGDARAATLGAIVQRQDETRTKSEAIAVALKKQAEQAGATGAAPQPHQGPSPAERFQKAAAHVDQAVAAMLGGNAALQAEPLEPEPVRDAQTRAAEELARAIEALQPPEQKNDQDQQQQQQQQQQQNQQQDKGDQREQAGALQAVRDREAKRRAKKDKKGVGADSGVEKDW